MHVHILGICGSFMGGIAAIAKSLGHTVTGSDSNVYPPMSTQLENLGIALTSGFDTKQFDPVPDVVVIGNAMSRGNPAVEYVLDRNLPYTSGPQWLLDNLLTERWVIAASGTHGKTSTASMIAWVLEDIGLEPGFLIGGVPENFGISARIGKSPFFIIEADEYDSAFFDKRSKFIHYAPRTLVMNNLEFDHADIFADLAAIQTQFHHLIRTVPNNGLIIYPDNEPALDAVIDRGCWTPTEKTNIEKNGSDTTWQAELTSTDGTSFNVWHAGKCAGEVVWSQSGKHNTYNAIAAIAAARNVGVTPAIAIAALNEFKGVKRRMERLGEVGRITLYDDFAHHPTAIQTTLEGLRAQVGGDQIIALIEPRSNTMRMGIHKKQLSHSCNAADLALWYKPSDVDWDLSSVIKNSSTDSMLCQSIDDMINVTLSNLNPNQNTHIVTMSNGGFSGIQQQLLNQIKTRLSS